MIACNDLHYSSTDFDHERYERLLNLTTKNYSELLDMPSKKIRSRFSAEIGYITPKISADAAIFIKHCEILFMDRIDESR